MGKNGNLSVTGQGGGSAGHWWLKVSGVEEADSDCAVLQDGGSGGEQKSMWLRKCKGESQGGWKSNRGNSQVPVLIN